jgi:Ca2+-transporting ATPase
MNQPPRSSQTTLLSRPFLFLIGWQAAMLAAIALGAYIWALGVYGPGPHSRTIALFALVSVQLGHTFNCRSRTRSAFEGIFRNPFLWIAVVIVVTLQLLAAYLPPLAAVLGTVKPSPTDWIVVGSCGLLPIIIVEITKFAFHWRREALSAYRQKEQFR